MMNNTLQSLKTPEPQTTTETQSTTKKVRKQYETFSYPGHIPLLAMPAHVEPELSLTTYCLDPKSTILVAGCGNFEPLVVAKANPRARIIAVDLAQRNLDRLKKRLWFARLIQTLLPYRRFGRTTPLLGDLNSAHLFASATFDLIVCTGVLHHCKEPNAVLANLARWLRPGGVLRLMVYAPKSRQSIYKIQHVFEAAGIHAKIKNLAYRELLAECRSTLQVQPNAQELLAAFESYSDIHTHSGLIDGFFHAHDEPIPIADLCAWARQENLELVGVGKKTKINVEDWILAETESRSKLTLEKQIEGADHAHALYSNPVLTFKKLFCDN